MKIKWLIIEAIVLLLNFSNCKANQTKELNMLTVKDVQISEAIKVVAKEESEYGNLEKSTIIIKIEKLGNGYEIRIGSLYKESMSSYLSDKKDKPFGFLDHDGISVIVFGEEEKLLFEKNSNMKIFSFLEANTELKVKKGEIPPPPGIYEPVVWIYIYQNGKLKLTDKGRLTLLI